MTTERDKRFLALESILQILSLAPRHENPDGSLSVRLTDDLCQKMINTIREYVEKGFDYLLQDLNKGGER
jgi:hypothetical protein